MKEPVYFFGATSNFAMYKNVSDPRFLDFGDEFINETFSGTVFILDFPQINKESALWVSLLKCKQLFKFSDKGDDLGYVFEC